MSGVWVVRAQPWVTAHPLLRQDLWDTICRLDGVAALDDAEVLSTQTIQEFALPQEQSMVKPAKPRHRRTKEQTNV